MRAIENIAEFKEVDGKAAQQWVRKQNATTRKRIDKTATFRKLYRECQLVKKKNTSIDEIWLGENNTYQKV